MAKADLVKDKEFFQALMYFINLFNGWVLGSIKQTYDATKGHENMSSPLVAFVLVSTMIDFVAGFWQGISNLNNPGSAGKTYKAFVKRYMPTYDPDLLYKDLRCRLTHNFTIGESYALIHRKNKLHGKRIRGTKLTIINFKNFYDDFENAVKQYVDDLENDDDLRKKFMTRYKLGIPAVFQIKGEITNIA